MKLLLILLISFSASASPTRTTTADQITSADTTKIYTLPSATDTLDGWSSTATLSNKTLASPFVTGKLGIGTVSPVSPLDVNGIFSVKGLSAYFLPPDFTANSSIGIGPNALAYQTIGTIQQANTAVGYGSMASSSLSNAATVNTALGYGTLGQLTTGSKNSAFGNGALGAITTGSQNMAIGAYTLGGNVTGNQNVGVGYSSLAGAGSQGYNTAIGFYAGHASTNSSSNTFIGWQTGDLVTTGNSNLILGASVASTTLTTGSNNILLGNSTAIDTPLASTSNFLNIGNTIFATNTNTGTLASPAGFVGIGTTTPTTLLTVSYNNANQSTPGIKVNSTATSSGQATIGYYIQDVLKGYTRADSMGNLGFNATGTGGIDFNYNGSTGTTNFWSGTTSTMSLLSSGNVGIGTITPAGPLDVTGTIYNNGATALWQDATSTNIALGTTNLSTTYSHTGGGYNGWRNVAIGYGALMYSTTGSENLAIGMQTLWSNSTGSDNVGIGATALFSNSTGLENTGVGARSLHNSTANGNTGIGSGAGYQITTGTYNTVIGDRASSSALGAGTGLTTGSNNLILGSSVAANTLTTGSSNILMGYGNAIDVPLASTSNFLNIGNTIFATGINTGTVAAPAGNVGIGTSAPTKILDIYQANSAIIGLTSNSGYPGMTTTVYSNTSYHEPYNISYRAEGTSTTPLTVNAGDFLGTYAFRGHDGTSFSSFDSVAIQAVVDSTWTTTNHEAHLAFMTSANGTVAATEKVRISSAGWVGIGITSPTNPLSVGGSANFAGSMLVGPNTSGGNYLFYGFNTPFAGAGGIVTGGSFPLAFGVGSAEKMRIDTSGNVGINTTTVTTGSMLDVNGHIRHGGAAPTISSCGGGTLVTGSSDQKGQITGITAATACTITFATSMPAASSCHFTASVAGISSYISSLTTSAVTAGMTALTGTLYYICL